MIAIIDFETTGLLDDKSNDFMRQPGITQIGLVCLDPKTLRETASFSTLVNPELAAFAWSKEAIAVTGIGPEQVKGSPSLLGVFGEFAGRVVGATVWSGYNIKFDMGVLWFNLLRYGLERNFPWPPVSRDIMHEAGSHLAKAGKRGQKRWKLGDAYQEILGKPMPQAHNALADCRGVADIMRALEKA